MGKGKLQFSTDTRLLCGPQAERSLAEWTKLAVMRSEVWLAVRGNGVIPTQAELN